MIAIFMFCYCIIFKEGIYIIMDIFLDSKIITDNTLSSNAIAVYTALRTIQNSNTNAYYVNIKLLAYQLSNNLILSRKYMERLSDGLNELIIKEYIMVVANNVDKDYILDIGNLIINNRSDENKDKTFFLVIKSEEIHKIMNLDCRLDKFSVLRYFMCMLNTINHNATYFDVVGNTYNNFVGFMTNDYIGSLCGVNSYTTYDKYNHLLEDNELIYIFRHDIMLRDDKGQLKNLPNHYGRYKDKELIIGYSTNRENFEFGEDAVNKRTNESRSLMQKYYCMVKYGTEYSEKEIKRIYKYVHYRNQQNEKKYEQEIEKGYSGENLLNRIVSEEVFNKYNYLFENKNFDSANVVDKEKFNDNWGEPTSMEQDISIKEILDMPAMGNVNNEQNIGNKSHGEDNHDLFCVTEKDLDLIDIDELF
ncbi:hypothetical protein IMSAGC020_00321 [Lachnospiraceae bacterium]|nr:hypothetical protein IMSAGC020_00321 [Lachnospiraceae bacterium]